MGWSGNMESPKVWSWGLWRCGALPPWVGCRDWAVGNPLWETVCLQKWVMRIGNPYEKKEMLWCLLRPEQHGMGPKWSIMGSTLLYKNVSRHRLFQTTLEFLVSFVATNQSKQLPSCFVPRCVYFNLSSLQYIFSTTVGGHLLRCSSDHLSSLLESFTIDVVTSLWLRRLFDLFLVDFSKLIFYNVLLKLYSAARSIALS